MAYGVYLVGGAVRDELLGLEAGERDWVVTGATPEELLEAGFTQVGASFPVFLHPESGEEYALARTERKSGHGYHGFAVDFHPGVSIEEDLLRRDLTVNAMARDEQGRLIDPYRGREDLERKILRHVSPAFAEDPLRVLRVARFAARFEPMGFSVHPETIGLMREITRSGELDHLVPERSWAEMRRALDGGRPSIFLDVLRDCGALRVLLPEVDILFGIQQPEKHHPEIDAGVHVGMAMDLAAETGSGPRVVFALLLHDVGKGLTAVQELPAHHGHEDAGLPLVDAVCERFRVPGRYRRLARQVCYGHLRCHRVLEMKPAGVMKFLERLDALRQKDVSEFVQACEADFRGRQGMRERAYPQGAYLRRALEAALAVQARDLGLGKQANGPEVGERLREARIGAIRELAVEEGD